MQARGLTHSTRNIIALKLCSQKNRGDKEVYGGGGVWGGGGGGFGVGWGGGLGVCVGGEKHCSGEGMVGEHRLEEKCRNPGYAKSQILHIDLT